MENNKKSFILHIDSLSVLDEMTDDQAGKLFKAIHNYQKGTEVELGFEIKMAFLPFRNQFIRNEESYQKVVERNKNNGSKGGRPSNPDKATETQKTQSVVEKPRKADSGNGSDSGNENKKDKEGFSLFFAIHKSYPGLKKTEYTEFGNFKAITKDWKTVLPLLMPAIQAQIASRKKKDWNPEWKTFGNWIKGRCWEEIPSSSASSEVEMSIVPGITAKEWDKMPAQDKCRAQGIPYV